VRTALKHLSASSVLGLREDDATIGSSAASPSAATTRSFWAGNLGVCQLFNVSKLDDTDAVGTMARKIPMDRKVVRNVRDDLRKIRRRLASINHGEKLDDVDALISVAETEVETQIGRIHNGKGSDNKSEES
jgi:hypothetical protein